MLARKFLKVKNPKSENSNISVKKELRFGKKKIKNK